MQKVKIVWWTFNFVLVLIFGFNGFLVFESHRGYYRCSSSKGCMARKQVERHRSDPGMFIVTYTAEHNHPAPTHRNSLAGSTRHKPVSSPHSGSVTGGDSTKAKGGSPLSPASSAEEEVGRSTTMMDAKEEKQSPMADEDETEFFRVCDTIVSDDFFVGLDGLAGDYFSDHSTASFGGPWSTATAASSIWFVEKSQLFGQKYWFFFCFFFWVRERKGCNYGWNLLILTVVKYEGYLVG